MGLGKEAADFLIRLGTGIARAGERIRDAQRKEGEVVKPAADADLAAISKIASDAHAREDARRGASAPMSPAPVTSPPATEPAAPARPAPLWRPAPASPTPATLPMETPPPASPPLITPASSAPTEATPTTSAAPERERRSTPLLGSVLTTPGQPSASPPESPAGGGAGGPSTDGSGQ